jgi:hypothetical protein
MFCAADHRSNAAGYAMPQEQLGYHDASGAGEQAPQGRPRADPMACNGAKLRSRAPCRAAGAGGGAGAPSQPRLTIARGTPHAADPASLADNFGRLNIQTGTMQLGGPAASHYGQHWQPLQQHVHRVSPMYVAPGLGMVSAAPEATSYPLCCPVAAAGGSGCSRVPRRPGWEPSPAAAGSRQPIAPAQPQPATPSLTPVRPAASPPGRLTSRPPRLPPQPQAASPYLAARPPPGLGPGLQYLAPVPGMPGMLRMAGVPGLQTAPAPAPKKQRDLKGREDQIKRTVYVGYIDPQVCTGGGRWLAGWLGWLGHGTCWGWGCAGSAAVAS